MQLIRALITSVNPNTYHELRDRPLPKVFSYALVAAAMSVIVFLLLLMPAVLQADAAARSLAATTTITLDGSFEQTQDTYVVRNPDILFAADGGDAFVVVSKEGITVKKFLWFGRETHAWSQFSSLSTVPATDLLVSLLVFAVPSLIVWGVIAILVQVALWSLLYSLIAYFILHSKGYQALYTDMWRVSVTASMPSMALVAVTPILRLGLPLGVIVIFAFLLWLSLTILGTVLFIEKKPSRQHKAA